MESILIEGEVSIEKVFDVSKGCVELRTWLEEVEVDLNIDIWRSAKNKYRDVLDNMINHPSDYGDDFVDAFEICLLQMGVNDINLVDCYSYIYEGDAGSNCIDFDVMVYGSKIIGITYTY